LAKDKSFVQEGFFKNGKQHGPQRMIKMSKRRPGCYTIREGDFKDGEECGPQKQTKVTPNNRLCQLINIENGSFCAETAINLEQGELNGKKVTLDNCPKLSGHDPYKKLDIECLFSDKCHKQMLDIWTKEPDVSLG
jgi:hypothetical protein